jgi:F-type H+-transporting ATPase subunit alpha
MSIERIINEVENSLNQMSMSATVSHVGRVESLQDGIVRISGLRGTMSSEVVYVGKDKAKALVLNLEEDIIGAVLLDAFAQVVEGDEVVRSEQLLSVPVSESVLGRKYPK